MKKAIIFLLILFNLITFNTITFAEYEQAHTLQTYESTLAVLSDTDTLQTKNAESKTENKIKRNYLKQDEGLMNSNMLFKALKAFFLACISFIMFIFVIVFLNKYFFKKPLPSQKSFKKNEDKKDDYELEDDEEENDDESSYKTPQPPLRNSSASQQNDNVEDIIYDFYKRNKD